MTNKHDPTLKTRVLLLVEDNPGDADLVRELLEGIERERYQILHAARMGDALTTLRDTAVDVVLLDLRLPDTSGLASVKAVRAVARDVPIVVLTGTDDESVALSCIDAGAQDYLCKAEIRAITLRRAIGYAITRLREAQLREVQETLARYHAFSSATSGTTTTAALAGSGAVAVRYPQVFAELVREYIPMLTPLADGASFKDNDARALKEKIVTVLGDATGGPRDLIDVHLAAFDKIQVNRRDTQSRFVVEGRLLALEMMGMLVDYYRVGYRRWYGEGGFR